ncbi:MAG: MFS transporter [Deltaproteobacteria bacterium]|nr:MFS transporter [Deltaproteobacteria bacterium]
MATVVAPVTFVQLLLTPLFGPIGDRCSRKRIAMLGDGWRLVTTAALAMMALSGTFHLGAVIVISLVHAVGSALFTSVSQSIIPQLVEPEHVETAIVRDQAITPVGTIIGGVVGGMAISILGPGGALLIDAGTFLLATAATASIAATPVPVSPHGYSTRMWLDELKQGFRVVTTIRVELGVAILAGLLNLALAPLDIALAYFVKEAQHQPAWLLGLLETSISLGAILGAMSIGAMQRYLRKSSLIFIGIATSGVVTMLLPWMYGVVLPVLALLTFGVCVIVANIPLRSQTTIAMPDELRSRATSVRTFIGAIAAPAGIAMTGWLVTNLGLEATLVVSGGAVFALSFGLFLIPSYRAFFDASAADASRFYKQYYPQAFASSEASPSAPRDGAAA